LSLEGWEVRTAPEVATNDQVFQPPVDVDVADEWLNDKGQLQRQRCFDSQNVPEGMRLIRSLRLSEGEADADHSSEPRRWSWYTRPRGADDEGSLNAIGAVLLSVHSADVETFARQMVEPLPLPPGVKRAVVLAAKHHDHGKNRRVWQRSIGNIEPERLFAKSGPWMEPLELSPYRHELGSILDAERGLLNELEPAERDLTLHLIAAHHGRARPHFPAKELFDPEGRGVDVQEAGLRVMERFARLQRRFGRWGLAYLESLVRAADYAASAHPSRMENRE
jgi:CRISPR-associated endonuclease/helicase Cas3